MKLNFCHCLSNKRDKWIPVRLNKRNLQKLNLKMERVSARLTSGDHLFISGVIGKKDETVQFGLNLVLICCDMENSNGDILFHVEDPYPKDFKLNSGETFFLAVYQINRFLDTNDISCIALYCRYVRKAVFDQKNCENLKTKLHSQPSTIKTQITKRSAD